MESFKWICGISLVVVGCGGSQIDFSDPDAEVPVDAGVPIQPIDDAGVPADATTISDGGIGLDGTVAPPDGGGTDAAVPVDAAGFDSGLRDSGSVDSGTDAGVSKYGIVGLSQNGTYNTYAFADFYNALPPSSAAECVTTTLGACTVSECDLTVDAGGGPTGTPPTAGEIKFSGGTIPAAIVLMPDASGAYTGQSGTTKIFSGGDTLRVAAAGGDANGVPPFDFTVLAPNDVVLATPLSFVTPLAINRAADLTLAWTGGGAGNVNITLTTSQTNQKNVTVYCALPANAGTAKVPAAAVAKLQTTGPGVVGVISVLPINTSTFLAGDYQLSFLAYGTTMSGYISTQ